MDRLPFWWRVCGEVGAAWAVVGFITLRHSLGFPWWEGEERRGQTEQPRVKGSGAVDVKKIELAGAPGWLSPLSL